MRILAGQLEDLATPSNASTVFADTFFTTGQGPGLVNAPVAPDTILVGRQGATPGISIVDLNGFGGGTGNPLPDPTSLAMSPNLDLIAVTNQQANVVSFVDINPSSSTFHQLVKSTIVGSGPRGIAWDPGNEDILVCNEADNTVSIVSAFSLEVRKIVNAQLSGPFDVAITPRQQTHGFLRNVYFAWILNRSGRVALFESGPNGVNGWVFDDITGVVSNLFLEPKAIQANPTDLRSAVWIAHQGPIDPLSGAPGFPGEGALSKVVIESALLGQLLLTAGSQIPFLRDMELAVDVSIGEDRLSGIPDDLAFDDLRNLGAMPGVATTFSAGAPTPGNSKGSIRLSTTTVVPATTPMFLFAAVPNSNGGIDVLQIGPGMTRFDTDPFAAGVQSIPAPNVRAVVNYWRQ